jgi:Cu/Ag efflux protein CusF
MKKWVPVVVGMVGIASFTALGLAEERSAPQSAGQQAEMPGLGVEAVATTTATVEAVDLDKRLVTLKGPKGNVMTIAVGPEVRNLPQVKVGDQVVVDYYEALALQLKKAETGVRQRTERVYMERAPLGAKPRGQVTRTVDAIGTVEAIDPSARTVTLRGTDYTVTLKAGKDVNLNDIKVGDNVEAQYVESLAIGVKPKR